MRFLLRFAAVGLVTALAGCAGTAGITALAPAVSGGVGQLGSAGVGLVGTIDSDINQLIMAKAASIHNLTVGLWQIQATPGMVTTVTPPPVIAPVPTPGPTPVMVPPVVTPSPTPSPAPAPTPPPPNPPPTGIPGTFPPSPSVSGSRHARHSAIRQQVAPVSFWASHPPSFRFEPGPHGLAAERIGQRWARN